MKTHKTILTLLAVVLAALRIRRLGVGVLGTALMSVFLIAASPPSDDLDDMLTSASRTVFGELSSDGQGLVEEAWTLIKGQAPQQYWDDEINSFVLAVRQVELEDDGVTQNGKPRRAKMVKHTLMRPGYTSSITGTHRTNTQLIVRVYVSGPRPFGGSRNLCEQCSIVSTAVYGPPNEPGLWSGVGNHEAQDPRGYGNSYAQLEIN